MDRASEIHGFRLRKTVEKRPDERNRQMKIVNSRLLQIGFTFEKIQKK